MKKMKKTLLLTILLSIGAVSINADMFTPSASCSKPYKPYEFTDQYQLDSFNDDVRRYKICIMDFVEEQNNAIRNHQNAQSSAIDEWNSFVNYELN